MGQSGGHSINSNANANNAAAKYIPMSRTDLKNFKQVASFQLSQSNPGQVSENLKGNEQVKSPAIISKAFPTEGNALKQPMSFSGGHLPLRNDKGQEVSDSSKPAVQDAALSKNEKDIYPSSTGSFSNHMRPEGGSQMPLTMEHSSNGNAIHEDYEKIGKTFETEHGQSNKMPSKENAHNSKFITLIGPPLQTMKPGFLKEKPSGLNSQRQKFSQHHLENTVGLNDGAENQPNENDNHQKMENHQEDFTAGQKQIPNEFKENLKYTFTDSNHMGTSGDERASKNKPTTEPSHKATYSKEEEMKQPSVTAIQEKPMPATSGSKATAQGSGLSQEKLSDKERPQPEQRPGDASSMSNKLQEPISQHAGQGENSLSNAKDKPTDGMSPQQVQSNSPKEHDSGTKVQQNYPQQGHAPNNPAPPTEGNKLHQATEGNSNEKSNSDQGQTSEEGEPVPMVDFNGGGTDFGPANGQEVQGPGEDPGMQSQPNGDTGEDYVPGGNGEGFASPDEDTASQHPGPVYDNEAIQGISDLAHKEDQNIFQQVNSEDQTGSDQNLVIGYNDASMSQGYTGESPRGENQDKIPRTQDDMQQESNSSLGSNGYKSEARLSTNYYNTEPADDCPCPKKGRS